MAGHHLRDAHLIEALVILEDFEKSPLASVVTYWGVNHSEYKGVTAHANVLLLTVGQVSVPFYTDVKARRAPPINWSILYTLLLCLHLHF